MVRVKKNITLIILLSCSNLTFSQIKVEKVELTETVDNRYVSKLPKLTSESEEKIQVVNKINAFILDRFMVESFDQSELEEFRWYDLDFIHEVKEGILYIQFGGEYYGAYPNYVEEELFFDLNTGEQLSNSDIPFQALFSLYGYLDFMNKFWLKKAKPAFIEAIECADYEPYCSYYDIYSYSINNDNINISLADDCYARVSRACSPGVSLTLPLDSIKAYLSKEGNQIIFADSYTSKKGIDKFLYNKSTNEKIPNNTYFFGKIDGKYPFSMALNFEKGSDNVSGYYYYDRKLEKLKLKGKKDDSKITLKESLNDVETGSFLMNLSKSYVGDAYSIYNPNGESTYLTGTWSNPEKTKNFNIEFIEVKLNDRN